MVTLPPLIHQCLAENLTFPQEKQLSNPKNEFNNGKNMNIFKNIPMLMYIVRTLSLLGLLLLHPNFSYSQHARVSLDVKNSSIEQILQVIEQQSGYFFLYNNRLINVDKKMDIQAKQEPISSILDRLFRDANIAYEVKGTQIILHPKGMDELQSKASPHLQHTQSQHKEISGTISDPHGAALPGATVVEKGVNNGTKTDAKGQFSLRVAENAVLSISNVGFLGQEISTAGRRTFSIVLKEDARSLDEIVVVGYGTMRKKDLTGCITQIRPDKLADENPKTVQDILRGVPGLVVGFDGSAKGGGSMQIRGQRSIYTEGNHNDPLIILDGMIFYGELSEINPDDISQIDVLKDASAAAVYGAKSANGVIIITTKKGQIGNPVINVSSNLGLAAMAVHRPVYDPAGFMNYREDYYTADTYGLDPETGLYGAYQATSGVAANKPGFFSNPNDLSRYGISLEQWRAYTNNTTGISDDEIFARRLGLESSDVTYDNYLAGKTFDWYKQSFRTGLNEDHNISLSGANDRINYYMSMGYLSNEGIVRGNDYKTIRSNLKVEGKISDWMEVGANINFQERTDGDLAVDWNRQITVNSPFANYRTEDGQLTAHPMGDLLAANYGYNHDFDRQFRDLEKGFMVLNSILSARIKLPFNISYSFNFSPRYQYFHDRYFESTQHPDWVGTNRGVNREQAKRFDWSLNNTINWDYQFAQKHYVNLTLVQEAEKRQYWMDRIEARNLLPSDALGLHETSTGDKDLSTFDSHDSKETADGMLGRLFYSYDDRYLITTSVRRDGYSAFGTSNPRATFYSVGLAWSFTNENFMQWGPLNMGKLRLSWGQNGNRSLADPNVALANLMGSSTGATQGYLNSNGEYVNYYYLSVSRLANRRLQWEKTTALNVGLDFSLLKDRLNGSVDYFVMPTTDMIMNQALPGFAGFSSITSNLGEVENRGIEITLNSLNVRRNNFEWRTTLGFSKYKNTIKHLYYVYEDILDANGNIVATKERDDVANNWFIGQPISAVWDYDVTGIWQNEEAAEAMRYGQRPGDPKVANNFIDDDRQNADGTTTPVYNDKDKEFLGQTAPPIHWSLRNDFLFFKDFSLSFNVYAFWGHKSLSTAYLNQDNPFSQITYNYNLYEKEYWTPDNPSNTFARINARGPSGLSAPQRLFDRSFVRLDNLSIGYSIRHEFMERLHIKKLRLNAAVRNVAVWKKDKSWNLWDIETGGPTPRVFTFGLSLTY